MSRILRVATAWLFGCFCSVSVHATAMYDAMSMGTLTLIEITGPLSVFFFGPDTSPDKSDPLTPGIKVVVPGGSTAGTMVEDASGLSDEPFTKQTAVAMGSRATPGITATNVLTTVLLDVRNSSDTETGTFTVRWDWSLDVESSVDDPLREFAGATAGAFLEDRTPGTPLSFNSLSVFGTDSDTASSVAGGEFYTLPVEPLGRNIVITGVDANGIAGVISSPSAAALLLIMLPLMLWQRAAALRLPQGRSG